MAHQVTLEDAARYLPELVRDARAGQHIVLTQGHQAVAALIPLNDDGPSATELAQLAMAGGAFDWLADEPDLYDDTYGEEIYRTAC